MYMCMCMYGERKRETRNSGQELKSQRATRPEWIYSQGFYFEPRVGGEVGILWSYNNKQTNKTVRRINTKQSNTSCSS